MSFFSLSFWKSAGEKAIVAGLATFASSDFFQHAFTLRGFEIAASAAGLAALYSLVKNAGAVGALKGVKAQGAK